MITHNNNNSDMDSGHRNDSFTTQRTLWRYTDGALIEAHDLLVIEKDVSLLLDGRLLTTLRCLPGNLAALGVGFLLSEGFLISNDELVSLSVDDAVGIIDVKSRIPVRRVDAAMASMRTGTACGGNVTVAEHENHLDCKRPYNLMFTVGARTVTDVFARFIRSSELYRSVGGVHSAAFSDGINLRHFFDDVGRHNAVDRAIGSAFLAGENPTWLILCTTGRLNAETVSKAARMRIPVVASRSAATGEAVDLAGRYHVTLCGRVRHNRMAVYSAPWRISPDDAPATDPLVVLRRESSSDV